MRKLIAAAALSALLVGCSRDLTLMSRQGSETGQGTSHSYGTNRGDLTIDLHGKRYSGQWVVAQGGSTGLLSSAAFSPRGGQATGFGSGLFFDMSKTGTALLKSADGSGLRCEFVVSSGTGYGVCQDELGLYDLQVY
jgi:hypothetical protein